MRPEEKLLELDVVIPEYFFRIFMNMRPSCSYFRCAWLVYALYLCHMVNADFRRLCRLAPKMIAYDGCKTKLGVIILGELLEIASFVATPVGAVLAVVVTAAAFYYGRWVLAD